MKKTILLSITILSVLYAEWAHAQFMKCDTLVRYDNYTGLEKKFTPTNWGLGVTLGFTHYKYQPKTAYYLGNHNGANFKLQALYRNFVLAFDFRPATIELNNPVQYGEQIITPNADFNVIKTDITLGYYIALPHKFGLEPQVGTVNTRFIVINEDELNESFDLPSVRGLTTGLSVYKFFQFKGCGDYYGFYVNANYNHADYTRLNQNMGKNFIGVEVGIATRGLFFRKVKGQIPRLQREGRTMKNFHKIANHSPTPKTA
jgi:hypothetical protein